MQGAGPLGRRGCLAGGGEWHFGRRWSCSCSKVFYMQQKVKDCFTPCRHKHTSLCMREYSEDYISEAEGCVSVNLRVKYSALHLPHKQSKGRSSSHCAKQKATLAYPVLTTQMKIKRFATMHVDSVELLLCRATTLRVHSRYCLMLIAAMIY